MTYIINNATNDSLRFTKTNEGAFMNVQDKVCDTVTKNYRTSTVFKQFGIDFCCNGNITIEEVCNKKNVDTEELMKALLNAEPHTTTNENYTSWSDDFLIEYIVQNHHNYLREVLPVIEQYITKVAKVHGGHTPSLIEIYTNFMALKKDLLEHIVDEEKHLFPLLKCLDKGEPLTKEERAAFEANDKEHKKVGSILEKMNTLANNYVPPLDACNTYRVSFSYLSELENDIHKHIHLENNVLFPRFIKEL